MIVDNHVKEARSDPKNLRSREPSSSSLTSRFQYRIMQPMMNSALKIICALLLVHAALVFSAGSVTGFDETMRGNAGRCCDAEDAGRPAGIPCEASGCLCMSCSSLVPVHSSGLHRALLFASSACLHPETFHFFQYISSIEHPPKTV